MVVYDVIVIGAGAAGLMAARQISQAGRSVCILEARDRIGGRIHTITDDRFPCHIEAGAEFIHGSLPVTLSLLQASGLSYEKVAGRVYQVRNGEWQEEKDFIERSDELMRHLKRINTDLPLAEFLEKSFPDAADRSFKQSVQRFASGYDAATTSRLSTIAFRDELENGDDKDFRPMQGYHALMEWLYRQSLESGSVYYCNHVVTTINWQHDQVVISAGGKQWRARKALVTIPLGIWQQTDSPAHIHFVPALPEKTAAAARMGFGGVIKIFLSFITPFWRDQHGDAAFMLADTPVPTWWTQQQDDAPMLSGWIAGEDAAQWQHMDEAALLELALQSLASIFSLPATNIRQLLRAGQVFNWTKDPFSGGAYSYPVVHAAELREVLCAPVGDRLFFAGEALYAGTTAGTVEAALCSGEKAASAILSSLAAPHRKNESTRQ